MPGMLNNAMRYRGTSLIRNNPLLGPCSRTMPRTLWWSYGGGAVSYERGAPVQVPLYTCQDGLLSSQPP